MLQFVSVSANNGANACPYNAAAMALVTIIPLDHSAFANDNPLVLELKNIREALATNTLGAYTWEPLRAPMSLYRDQFELDGHIPPCGIFGSITSAVDCIAHALFGVECTGISLAGTVKCPTKFDPEVIVHVWNYAKEPVVSAEYLLTMAPHGYELISVITGKARYHFKTFLRVADDFFIRFDALEGGFRDEWEGVDKVVDEINAPEALEQRVAILVFRRIGEVSVAAVCFKCFTLVSLSGTYLFLERISLSGTHISLSLLSLLSLESHIARVYSVRG
jgi:hypothetical protein